MRFLRSNAELEAAIAGTESILLVVEFFSELPSKEFDPMSKEFPNAIFCRIDVASLKVCALVSF